MRKPQQTRPLTSSMSALFRARPAQKQSDGATNGEPISATTEPMADCESLCAT